MDQNTSRQEMVLNNLHRVIVDRRNGRRPKYRLDGEDCRQQVNSLRVKGAVQVRPDGVLVRSDPHVDRVRLALERADAFLRRQSTSMAGREAPERAPPDLGRLSDL